MINENLLNPKSMYICTNCASVAEENQLSPEQAFLDLVPKIQKGEFSSAELATLAAELGKCQASAINISVDELFGCYKKYTTFGNFDPHDFLSSVNSILLPFLKSLTDFDYHSHKNLFL